MFCIDIESLGVESTSAILSIGACYVEDARARSYQELLDNSIFIKLDVREQFEKYKRTTDGDTITWWEKQCEVAKKRSYYPRKDDLSVEEGLTVLGEWIKSFGETDAICWVRGSLDQPCIDSLHKAAGIPVPFKYNAYRDIRTALDIIYPDTSNGYVEVDTERCVGFTPEMVLKHSPEFDATYDLAMLLYGKQS